MFGRSVASSAGIITIATRSPDRSIKSINIYTDRWVHRLEGDSSEESESGETAAEFIKGMMKKKKKKDNNNKKKETERKT